MQLLLYLNNTSLFYLSSFWWWLLVEFLQARGGAPFFGGPEVFGGGTMEKWQPESLLMRRERRHGLGFAVAGSMVSIWDSLDWTAQIRLIWSMVQIQLPLNWSDGSDLLGYDLVRICIDEIQQLRFLGDWI